MIASLPVSPPDPSPIKQRGAPPALSGEFGPSPGRVSAKASPRSHSAGILRSERQLITRPPGSNSDSGWLREDAKVRWQFAVPPKGNVSFAWVQHFINHLAPQGMIWCFRTNRSMFSNQAGDCPARSSMKVPKAKPQSLPRQRGIRHALIKADLVACMIALPGQLFYSTQIPVCLCFLAENKAADAERDFSDHRKQTLLVLGRNQFTHKP